MISCREMDGMDGATIVVRAVCSFWESTRGSFEGTMLSHRGEVTLGLTNPAFDNIDQHRNNPYSADNPAGVVKLSTADNNLCKDIILEKWNRISFQDFDTTHLFRYPQLGGLDSTKQTIAKFIDRYFAPEKPIDFHKLSVIPGITSAFDAISCAICDPGDGILCPAPYYLRIYNDYKERASVEIIPVPSIENNEVTLKVEHFETALKNARNAGTTVKAILLVNPNNPTGKVHDRNEIQPIIDWAMRNNLFVLANEIYAQSIYSESERFTSVLRYLGDLKQREHLIWMWGTSKDFCLPGMRFGVVYTENQRVVDCLHRFELFQPTIPLIQYVIAEYLSDYEWIDSFFETNRHRLKEAKDYLVAKLEEAGIKTMPSHGGFFVLADFRKFLREPSIEAEEELNEKFMKHGVLLVTGDMMRSAEPGWFRIVFTGLRNEINEGVRRMKVALSLE